MVGLVLSSKPGATEYRGSCVITVGFVKQQGAMYQMVKS